MMHHLRSFTPVPPPPFQPLARWLRAALAASLACAAGPMRAADAPSVPSLAGASLEELLNVRVTTVSREESTVGQSAAAVFVITPEMIRRSGATVIPELFRMVPGMNVARIDGNKWAVSARGFNQRFANKLLVQVDGRSVYTLQVAGVYWDAVDYPLEDIERIEVIRGPGASVWGANAVNGIINIITKSSRDTQGGLLSGGAGTEERGFTTFRFGGKIGDHLTYRVYGKGFAWKNQFSLTGDPNDQWRGTSGGLRLDWKPNSMDTLTLDAGFSRSEAGRKDNFPLAAGPPFAVPFPEDETTEDTFVRMLWSRQLDTDSGWQVQASWNGWQRVGDNGFANTRFDTFDLDFQHRFTLGDRQKIVWGLGFRYVDAQLDNSESDGGFFLSWLDTSPYSQVFSAFVQDEIALVPDRLSLTLGTKIEHNNFTGIEVQPTGRLLWTPTKRQSAWAAVSRAVRTRTFTENDAQFTLAPPNPNFRPAARIVANRDLQPEEVWAFELGYRAQATDAFSVDTALFYNDYNGLRANRINPALASTVQGIPLAASQFANAMDGETYGAEVAATWQVTERWRLYAAYTLLKTNLHRDPDLGIATEAAEGQSAQQQVYVQSSLNLPWNVEFDVMGRFVDRLSGFNPTGLPGVSDTVNDYFALDARLAWRVRENLTLELVGQNLLDNHHPEFGTNAFLRSPLGEIERAVYVKVTLTW